MTEVRSSDRAAPEDPSVGRATVWDRLATLIAARPGRVLAVALIPILLPLLALPSLHASHDTIATLPDDAESVQGYRALDRHLPAGETAPVLVIIQHDGTTYGAEALRVLGDASIAVRRLPGVVSVRSVALPTDGRQPDDDGETAEALAQLDRLSGELAEAGAGAGAIAAGAGDVAAALGEVERELPELLRGLQRAQEGAASLEEGSARPATA
jgi:putative drug exporter of the RND superfamily